MKVYRRRLPHIDAPGVPSFVTFRLHGSLPKERVFFPENLTDGQTFALFDRLLDAGRHGPTYLRRDDVARIACAQIEATDEKGFCSLHAYVVMPNHVHLLWTNRDSQAQSVGRVKGVIAREANRVLNRTGRFWQEEYFDRLLREPEEFARVLSYIEQNPVRAGLVKSAELFPWRGGKSLDCARFYDRANG
jgi:REP element-mobilizing transposase RayT